MQKLTCSKETAQKLDNRGLDVEAYFIWHKNAVEEWRLNPQSFLVGSGGLPALTVTEIFKLMPLGVANGIEVRKEMEKSYAASVINYKAAYEGENYQTMSERAEKPAEALCEVLLRLDEEGAISLDELKL